MRPQQLDAIRDHLAGKVGPSYWRSLKEMADSAEFREMLYREFPEGACEPDDSLSRRNFLKLMGASLALAGAAGGCWKQPEEMIVPYVEQPELIVPGKPLYFATSFPYEGYGIGVLAESHTGRPTKIEGNPDHPASLGATNTYAQASVLSLYDPDRSQTVNRGVNVSTWETFLTTIRTETDRLRQSGGAGLRLLTGTVTSPTLVWQIRQLLEMYPNARWHRFDPIGRSNTAKGVRQAFNQPVDAVYDFGRAEVIVSFESDFLIDDPGSVRYARDFIRRRRILRTSDPDARTGELRLNKLFMAEACPTITGAMADARIPVRSSRIRQLVLALVSDTAPPDLSTEDKDWVRAIAQTIGEQRGNSLFLAGESQPPEVHALVHAFNATLDNVGKTVRYIQPVAPQPDANETLEALVRDIDAGHVDTLVMIDTNPAYTAPADLNFAQALLKVPLRVHMGMYNDETAFLCHWHIPMPHYLESWSDIRAFDGTASIIQPLIQPLYSSRTAHELLAALLGTSGSTSYEIVRSYWQTRGVPPEQFESTWRQWLHHGTVLGESTAEVQVAIDERAVANAMQSAAATAPSTQPSDTSLEIIFRPDPSVRDGTYSNNGWLQELPKPITKLTWDNAACISPATARRRRVSSEDKVAIGAGDQMIHVPVLIVPGHADDCLSLTLGYGRTRKELQVAFGKGFNAYLIRTSSALWFIPEALVEVDVGRYDLATTQEHFNMEGRHLIRTVAAEQVLNRSANEARRLPLSIYPDSMPSDPPYRPGTHQWGMSIDLSSCIGCNACVVACQAENNIPIVGKEGVQRSREMHWIRIDTYFSAAPGVDVSQLANPQVYFQPVPCMHCEKAPCEVVCPVAATTHSDEGLNEMTYNRCIGTRYCSNNCPYKVRRFNFFEYNPKEGPEILRMLHNPDVTVRSRGVMEKCTYCVQRINTARIEAKKQDRRVYDGEVVPACAQACPTQAIVFGDITDPKSQVHEMKFKKPFALHDYGLLNEELGTRPRTTYLPKVVAEARRGEGAPPSHH